MIPFLEAISTSDSALPIALSSAPPVAGTRGSGGFASALAAAQGLSSASQGTSQGASQGTSQSAESDAESSDRLAPGSKEAPVSLNGRMPAAGNAPAKKLPSGNAPAAASVLAAVNAVVPQSVPQNIPAAASQVTWLGAQPSLIPTSVTPAGLPATLTVAVPIAGMAARISAPNVSQGPAQSGSQTAAYAATAKNTSADYSAPGPAAETFSSMASSDGTTGSLTSLATMSGSFIPIENDTAGQAQTNAQETAKTDSAQLPVLAPVAGGVVSGRSAVVASNQWESSRNELTPAKPTLLAANTQPYVLSAGSGQPASGNSLLNLPQDGEGSASLSNGSGFGAAELTLQADQWAPSEPTPTLLAKASPETGVAIDGLPFSGAVVQSGQAKASNATATNASDTAGQGGLTVETGTGNPLAGIANNASSVLSALNTAAQLAPGRISARAAVPRIAAALTSPLASPSGRATGAAVSVSSASSSSTGSESGNGSAMASQTPFSVFFSSPGPGTESAASTLPKMILPAASSAIHSPIGDSQIGGAAAPGVSSQSGGGHSGVAPSGSSQNPVPTSAADQAANESGSLPAGQSLRSATDLNAASAPGASSQVGAAAGLAAPTASGTTLPLLQQPAPAAASLPKPDTLPGTTPGNQATTVLATAENPAAAAAGPVQVAQMVSRVGQSEMRIGMNTSAFGSVEVRTVVHASDVGLTIGSEKGDLRGLLGNEMPGITNTLQQQNLRLNSVSFTQGFGSSNNASNASGGGDSQQRSFVPQPVSPATTASVSSSSEAAGDDATESLPARAFGGGFSILA